MKDVALWESQAQLWRHPERGGKHCLIEKHLPFPLCMFMPVCRPPQPHWGSDPLSSGALGTYLLCLMGNLVQFGMLVVKVAYKYYQVIYPFAYTDCVCKRTGRDRQGCLAVRAISKCKLKKKMEWVQFGE